MGSSIDPVTGLVALVGAAGMIIHHIDLKRRKAKVRVQVLEGRLEQLEERLQYLEGSDGEEEPQKRSSKSSRRSRSAYQSSRYRSRSSRSAPPPYQDVYPGQPQEGATFSYPPQQMQQPYQGQPWASQYPSNADIFNHWRNLSDEYVAAIVAHPATSPARRAIAQAVLYHRGLAIDAAGQLQRVVDVQNSHNEQPAPRLSSPFSPRASRKSLAGASNSRGEILWEQEE